MEWRIPQKIVRLLSGSIRIYPGIWNLYSTFELLAGYSMKIHIFRSKIAVLGVIVDTIG
jgi:hypothetical protein